MSGLNRRVALLTTVLAAAGPTRVVAGHAVANLAAFHDGFLVAAGVAVLAVGAALSVRDADAAATMVPRHLPGRTRFSLRRSGGAGREGRTSRLAPAGPGSRPDHR